MQLETERLILRPWQESDAENLYQYAKDPEVGTITGWPPHKNAEESREVIRHVLCGRECYAICLKTDRVPIGCIELRLNGHTDLTEQDDECELGYWLGRPFWGRGIMPEAAAELIRHGFEEIGMTKIWCGYYDGNHKSRRVQEKLGFRYQWTTEDVDVPLLHEKRVGHVNCMTKEEWTRMRDTEQWLQWAIELQSLAQAGLTYGKDVYDRERYERIREISAEIVAHQSELPFQKVMGLFCNETGYQTPKLDTRAAIFVDEKVLLVHENNGKWSLPGGWVDVNVSVKENTIKEVKEEAGLDVTADRIIAVQDRAKHNLPVYAYGVCKIFVLCSLTGGAFQKNIETTGYRFFSENELPELATEKNTEEQIRMCFDAHRSGDWEVVFD